MDLAAQIRQALTSQGLPPPSQPWLLSLISSRNPPPPLQSLIATARTRLLAADLTAPGLLDASSAAGLSLPAADVAAAAAEVREARLPRDVVVQVLDIENLSRSLWEQVEELEAVERGELKKGREIVRLPVMSGGGGGEDGEGGGGGGGEHDGTGAAQGSMAAAAAARAGMNATHRLVLQDCKGQKVFGLEHKRIARISMGTLNIGEKLVIKSGAVVARGVILLEPSNCKILGGKVDSWQKAWLEGRLARLREAVGANGRR